MDKAFIKYLKGGSLASTAIYKLNGEQVVLKKVDLKDNREYGYYRWQSQVRLLIRFSKKWPELFPKIKNYGVKEDSAFYTIPYYEGWINAYEYLQQVNISTHQLQKLADNILKGLAKLHSENYGVFPDAWTLYYREEVAHAASSIPQEILKHATVTYNGREHQSFLRSKRMFYEIGSKIMPNIGQAEVHGNLTLENILVSPDLDLVFIDPYFEVGIGAPLGDYAQLLQSSNSDYEDIMAMYDKGQFKLMNGRELFLFPGKSSNVKFINNIFLKHIKEMGCNAYLQARWLEVSQFIRMLPFKFAVDERVGNLIYIYTCHLIDEFIGEFNEF